MNNHPIHKNISSKLDIKERSFGALLNLLIIFYWIGMVYGSSDTSIENEYLGGQIILLPLQNFFFRPLIYEQLFSGFELIFIILVFLIFNNIERKKKSTHKLFVIFFNLTFVIIIFGLINPNNNFTEGLMKFLYIKRIRYFYYCLAFMYLLGKISIEDYTILIKKFFKYGVIVVFSRVALSIFFFLNGNGMVWYGRNVTIIYGDILFYIASFHYFLFCFYLITREKKYLIISIIFFLCVFLSYRRSSLFIGLIADLIMYISYLLITKKSISRLFVNAIYISLFFILSTPLIKSNVFEDYLYRYGAALEFTGLIDVSSRSEGAEYTDSGHIEQSTTTTKFFFDNIDRFWGAGIMGEKFLVPGQSEGGIHNNIVQVWAMWGLYMVFYYIILFLYMIKIVINIYVKTKKYTVKNFMCLSTFVLLSIQFISGWFSGYTFTSSIAYFSLFILFFSTYKIYDIDDKNENIIDLVKN